MKIGFLSVPPEASAERASAAGGTDGTLAKLHWRRALEQAQWELRGHARPALEDAATANREDAPALEQSPAPAPRAGAAYDPATSDRAAHQSASPLNTAFAAPAPASHGELARPLPSNQPPASLGDALRAAASMRDTDGLRTMVERCVQLCTRFPQTHWMPVVTHVHLDGRVLSVTLRDARVAAREAEEIHYRLRERLAQMGLELGELIINGQLVTPASAG